jgi:hypothetical protein
MVTAMRPGLITWRYMVGFSALIAYLFTHLLDFLAPVLFSAFRSVMLINVGWRLRI